MKVILLKNKTTPADPYEDLLQKSALDHVFIPLLKHTHMPKQCLRTLGVEYLSTLDAIIITSQRAVECLQQSILGNMTPVSAEMLLSKPVYTVGPATAKFIQTLGFTDIRGGSDAGNGSLLSDIISADMGQNGKLNNILFLVGEVRKDIIPRKLSQTTNIHLTELVIYKTEGLEDTIQRFNDNFSDNRENVVVFFSPQGTERIVSQLQDVLTSASVKVISIGPTTKEYLMNASIVVDQVCAKPDATSLLKCIKDLH